MVDVLGGPTTCRNAHANSVAATAALSRHRHAKRARSAGRVRPCAACTGADVVVERTARGGGGGSFVKGQVARAAREWSALPGKPAAAREDVGRRPAVRRARLAAGTFDGSPRCADSMPAHRCGPGMPAVMARRWPAAADMDRQSGTPPPMRNTPTAGPNETLTPVCSIASRRILATRQRTVDRIRWQGTCNDPETGNIKDRLAWTSDIDGSARRACQPEAATIQSRRSRYGE